MKLNTLFVILSTCLFFAPIAQAGLSLNEAWEIAKDRGLTDAKNPWDLSIYIFYKLSTEESQKNDGVTKELSLQEAWEIAKSHGLTDAKEPEDLSKSLYFRLAAEAARQEVLPVSIEDDNDVGGSVE